MYEERYILDNINDEFSEKRKKGIKILFLKLFLSCFILHSR